MLGSTQTNTVQMHSSQRVGIDQREKRSTIKTKAQSKQRLAQYGLIL